MNAITDAGLPIIPTDGVIEHRFEDGTMQPTRIAVERETAERIASSKWSVRQAKAKTVFHERLLEERWHAGES